MRQLQQPITHVLAFVEEEERAGVIKALLTDVRGISTELAYTVSHIQRYSAAAPVDAILLDFVNTDQADVLRLIAELSSPGSATSFIPLTGLFAEDSTAELRLAALDAGLMEIFVEPTDEVHLLTRLVLLGRIKQAEDQIRQLAITDPVTGLFDKRFFFLRLGEELSRARRYSRPLTCMICAIDAAPLADGEDTSSLHRLLRQAAVILQAEKRDIDVLARTGHTELSLLLYNTDVPGAVILAERIRSQFAELDPDDNGERAKFTVGLASTKANDEPSLHPEEFRQRAELALQQALDQGGGCNVIYAPDLTRQLIGA